MTHWYSIFILVVAFLISNSASAIAEEEKVLFSNAQVADLDSWQVGETYIVDVEGRRFKGIYSGKGILEGRTQHILKNTVEIDSKGAAIGVGISDKVDSKPNAIDGNNTTGRLLDGFVSSALTGAVYNLVIVPPSLRESIKSGQNQLNEAKSKRKIAEGQFVIRLNLQQGLQTQAIRDIYEQARKLDVDSVLAFSKARSTKEIGPNILTPIESHRSELIDIRHRLTSVKISSVVAGDSQAIGFASIEAADHFSSIGLPNHYSAAKRIATTMADVLVGLDPFTGFARDVLEAYSGVNQITGQSLEDSERLTRIVFATGSLLTGGGVGTVRGAARVISRIGRSRWFRRFKLRRDIRKFVHDVWPKKIVMSNHATKRAERRHKIPKNSINEALKSKLRYYDARPLKMGLSPRARIAVFHRDGLTKKPWIRMSIDPTTGEVWTVVRTKKFEPAESTYFLKYINPEEWLELR